MRQAAAILALLTVLGGCRTRTEIRAYIYQPHGQVTISPEILLDMTKPITPTLEVSP